jgi:serine/threonine-protein kinase
VSADRFRREIQLAARLHHPHIVPLLAAGEVKLDGDQTLLYYTMPLVDGESLRARLARDGKLQPTEALRIFREVTDALAYAHGQGVVHRDIKPDNILLSGGHAEVTDFGVAKALSSANSTDPALTATSIGMVIGTPAYMSPEQVTGDPNVGPLADIYALGVTAHEMLGGKAPFTGPTAQSILAAHLTQEAPSLDTLRSDLPPALAPLVRRCLAKDPAGRPVSASDLLRQLEQVVQPTPQPGTLASAIPTKPHRRWMSIGAGAAVAAIVLAGLWFAGVLGPRSLVAEGKFTSRDAVMLARVDVVGDSALSGALTEALRIDLGQSGVLTLVPTSQVRNALTMMRRPVESEPNAEVAREVAVRTGAKAVVVARAEPVAGQYVVTLRLISAETGDDLAAFRQTAMGQDELLPALDRASKELRRRIGESLKNVRASPPMEQVTTSSMAALQKYSQAIKAYEREDYDRAIALLREAVTIDTTFAMAWRKLGVAIGNSGNRARAVEPLRRAFAHRDRLTETERYMTEGSYYTSVEYDTPRAIAAYRSALDINPLEPTANNNLALLLENRGQYADAATLMAKTVHDTVSGLGVGGYRNMAFAWLSAGQVDSARATVTDGLARSPGDLTLAGANGIVLYIEGKRAEAQRAYLAAGRDARTPSIIRSVTLTLAARVPAVEGRLQEADGLARQSLAFESTQDRPLDYYRAAGLLGEIEATRSGPARGRAILDSTVAHGPMHGALPAERPYAGLAALYARLGDPVRARALLAEEATALDSLERRGTESTRRAAQGEIALQEGKPTEAIAQFRAGLDNDASCLPCFASQLSRAFDAAGVPDSAAAWGERYLASTSRFRAGTDWREMPALLIRMGDLAAEKGNRAKAAEYYQKYIDLRREADPVLQPQVAEVKKKLASVAGEKN